MSALLVTKYQLEVHTHAMVVRPQDHYQNFSFRSCSKQCICILLDLKYIIQPPKVDFIGHKVPIGSSHPCHGGSTPRSLSKFFFQILF